MPRKVNRQDRPAIAKKLAGCSQVATAMVAQPMQHDRDPQMLLVTMLRMTAQAQPSVDFITATKSARFDNQNHFLVQTMDLNPNNGMEFATGW